MGKHLIIKVYKDYIKYIQNMLALPHTGKTPNNSANVVNYMFNYI